MLSFEQQLRRTYSGDDARATTGRYAVMVIQ